MGSFVFKEDGEIGKGMDQEDESNTVSKEIIGRSQNQETIALCRQEGRLFEDEKFPLDGKSLNFSGSCDSDIRWIRPHEVVDSPQFISEGFSRNDIGQGELGNCWILASLAGLAERPELIRQIVPAGQSMLPEEGYCGAFIFRLRRFGQVHEVIVDDRLPAVGNELLYAQPINGEFWVCLLEKALAKFSGCYESLESGYIFESLTDMTGGVCEHLELKEDAGSELSMAELMQRMRKWIAKGCVIGASSISSETGEDFEMENGLVFSHAYSVTDVKEVQEKRGKGNCQWRPVNLVRLRNPWGNTEWHGKWSDTYEGWSDEQKAAVGLVVQDDGEFWMEASDFLRFFTSMDVLHLAANSNRTSGNSEWCSQSFPGKWIEGSTAGGQPFYSDTHWKNPSFMLKLTDSPTDEDDLATCIVSLEEPSQRKLPAEDRQYAAKAAYLYKVKKGATTVNSRSKCAGKTPFQASRTIVHTFRVKPGRYWIVPCTIDPGTEAEFLLTVFTEA